MATIEPYETKAGRRYKVQYRTPDRKATTKRGFKRKKDAELFAAEIETTKASGTFISPTAGNITLSKIHEVWEHGQKQLSTRSQRNNASSWRVHVQPKWGTWPVGRITTGEVRKWIAQLQDDNGRDTVLRALHVLRSHLDVAVEEHRIKVNPAVKIQVKREVRPKRPYLTIPQVNALSAAMNGDQAKTLIYVLAYCGPRINEATALNVADYDKDARRISITKAVKGPGEIGPTKTYEQRSVPVPKFVAAMINRIVEGRSIHGPLFTSPEGARLDADNFRLRQFKPGVKAAQEAWSTAHEEDERGFPTITPHALRHTCASMAISAGANVMAVQKLLGHENAAVTLGIYADLFPDDLDQVADALDALHARLSKPGS
ncbi:tyrosine-type recombinase/integrase [Corynebacterium pacaense]|uniref:tyrosine-type recombinase/integrase n=1 Tax=Corynebacterium pacaense TaxID=1816684 RepID=UPI0015C41CAA|nr:tyrosine-type recombinase/integrase [Corynebacterium pacaense]